MTTEKISILKGEIKKSLKYISFFEWLYTEEESKEIEVLFSDFFEKVKKIGKENKIRKAKDELEFVKNKIEIEKGDKEIELFWKQQLERREKELAEAEKGV